MLLLLRVDVQLADAGRPRQAAVGRGLGLGPDVAQRLHGRAVVRRVGAGQGRRRRLVQAAQSGGGRVLRRAVSERGRSERRRHAQGRRTLGNARASLGGLSVHYGRPAYSRCGHYNCPVVSSIFFLSFYFLA